MTKWRIIIVENEKTKYAVYGGQGNIPMNIVAEGAADWFRSEFTGGYVLRYKFSDNYWRIVWESGKTNNYAYVDINRQHQRDKDEHGMQTISLSYEEDDALVTELNFYINKIVELYGGEDIGLLDI